MSTADLHDDPSHITFDRPSSMERSTSASSTSSISSPSHASIIQQDESSTSSPPRRILHLPPLIEKLEKFILYETKARFYLVGSNASGTRFRVLKLDRTDGHDLHIDEDPTVYDRHDIHHMLAMIQAGNKGSGGLTKCVTAFGVIGFVRFLHGYYLYLITSLRKVGTFGGHIIYMVEDTALIPIPHPSVYESNTSASLTKQREKKVRAYEARYKSLFQVMDLTKNFYFSYTLDLTHTLQYTMIHASDAQRPPPKTQYVWNQALLTPCQLVMQEWALWTVPLIHGFFEQQHCSVFGRMLTLTLISRRSRYFAGTRYLKRGLNDIGHVANDVETEQILHERAGGSAQHGNFTSHVQLRASIPLFWSQESNAMVARPTIVVQKVDPLHLSTRHHMSDLFLRYGSPILALNLVKQNERRPRESIIGDAFGDAVQFINQWLPQEHKIDYYAWDFKRVSKSKTVSVVDELAIIAQWALQRTGLFHSCPHPAAQQIHPEDTVNIAPTRESIFSQPLRKYIAYNQSGVMRSNCIDSLDRTNVAQFCVGKCALGYQLCAMGIIDTNQTESTSEIVNILLDMYERMGDCLAMQYGGSQMHRQMKKDRNKTMTMAPVLYRQKAPNKPKEMFVSIMRHYQNSFQDTGKQDAMNLFLGTFVPSPITSTSHINIWDLSSDYYLHNKTIEEQEDVIGKCCYNSDAWFRDPIRRYNLSLIPSTNTITYTSTSPSTSTSTPITGESDQIIPMEKTSTDAMSQALAAAASHVSPLAASLSPNTDIIQPITSPSPSPSPSPPPQQQSQPQPQSQSSIPYWSDPPSSRDLAFTLLYQPTELSLFDEMLLDPLYRVKPIRMSGIKEEKKQSFGERLRRTLKREQKTTSDGDSTLNLSGLVSPEYDDDDSPQQSPRTIDPKRNIDPKRPSTLSHLKSRNVTFATTSDKPYHKRTSHTLTTSMRWDSMKILGISMDMNVDTKHMEFLHRYVHFSIEDNLVFTDPTLLPSISTCSSRSKSSRSVSTTTSTVVSTSTSTVQTPTTSVPNSPRGNGIVNMTRPILTVKSPSLSYTTQPTSSTSTTSASNSLTNSPHTSPALVSMLAVNSNAKLPPLDITNYIRDSTNDLHYAHKPATRSRQLQQEAEQVARIFGNYIQQSHFSIQAWNYEFEMAKPEHHIPISVTLVEDTSYYQKYLQDVH